MFLPLQILIEMKWNATKYDWNDEYDLERIKNISL